MKIDLTGKTAIVTGSTEGIGKAIAKGLAECGARVVINGRKPDKVEATVQELAKEIDGGEFTGVAADLGTAAGCEELVRAVPEADIVVNNVGIFGPQDFFEVEDEVWQQFFDVNVMSGVRVSRAYLPGMKKRGWGRVIFISSESGLNIPKEMIHYGMTKTANISIARGLAKQMAGTGVTVNSVLPGPTLSDGLVEMIEDDAKKAGKSVDDYARDFVMEARPGSLIQRPATVEEVASMVVYVASPLASATTGAALRVDGGVVDTIA
ncbi:SDR family NAD(P)-dependent oxidoreductase [Rubinisphaera margarita]|uniref:SDR family NAD(P)-dependent oxidoreductase n=1 Tax=Rubinisphaera margarita TaxID=2909586 RepID=UPI001EE9A86B|nr:SDR family oxidoreductase [Rubinisphaera margarita]MCG6155641.1 SDR family oxidoreductase [Rubinisphaera margarita]